LSQPENNILKGVLAFILCAGEGTRIQEYHKDSPKPLLGLKAENNRSILELLLTRLFQQGVPKIIIAKGYQKEKIEEFIVQFRRNNGLSSDQLTAIYAGLWKLGPLFSFLSVLEDKSVILKNKHLLIIPGDTIFEVEILRQIFKAFIPHLTQLTEQPLIFYRKIKARILLKKHKRALNKVEKLISVALIEESPSNVEFKGIIQENLKNYNLNDIIYQIIPFFILNLDFIEIIREYLSDDLVRTFRQAINHSIKDNVPIHAVEIITDSDFYDIDTKLDLEQYEKLKRIGQ